METYIAYFDETGDDSSYTKSSTAFILTSLYMAASDWQENYNTLYALRKELSVAFGFPVKEEMHTKHFLTDKNPYRNYNWDVETKKNILHRFLSAISTLKVQMINVIIDKTKIKNPETYEVLEKALTYNIQRIENDSKGLWNFIAISDEGRIAPMRRTIRKMRVYNPIPSKFEYGYADKPVKDIIEDILSKDSKESYFIQICDFISYFIHLYFKCVINNEDLPVRVQNILNKDDIVRVMDFLKQKNILNLKANSLNQYGLVIYPR